MLRRIKNKIYEYIKSVLERAKKSNSYLLIFVFTVLSAVLLINWLVILLKGDGWEETGFNFSNSLFSGIAFLGIIWSIRLQQKELKLQRKELKLQRKELALQRKEMKSTNMEFDIQNQTMKLQRFENTFFQMLELHNQIINNLGGRDKFAVFVEKLEKVFNNKNFITVKAKDNIGDYAKKGLPDTLEEAKQVFEKIYLKEFYQHIQSSLNHYFRNLYHILKYVYLSNLLEDDQRAFYAKLVRAQLSQYELHLLMFNSMQENYGYPKALFLIKEYNMLKNFVDEEVKPIIYYELWEKMQINLKDPFKNKKLNMLLE